MQTSLFIRLDKLANSKTNTGFLPISRASVLRYCREGLFPPPIKLGPRITAWSVEEIGIYTKARQAGASDIDIRKLVEDLVKRRLAL
jgi:predicted DNA-binding transcriptional regulator AlpA